MLFKKQICLNKETPSWRDNISNLLNSNYTVKQQDKYLLMKFFHLVI